MMYHKRKDYKKMFVDILLVSPLYVIIFILFFKFRYIIKAMENVNDMFANFISSETPSNDQEINKREFLIEKIKNGEQISCSKTPWTEKRLQEASDKVIDKLYDNYQNSPSKKIDKQEALELGKPMCPIMIDMYCDGLNCILDKIPYVSSKYRVNVEKLKHNISSNKLFCDTLAIKIGSKMIEQMGGNSSMQMSISLASMTWDAIEPITEKKFPAMTEEKEDCVELN